MRKAADLHSLRRRMEDYPHQIVLPKRPPSRDPQVVKEILGSSHPFIRLPDAEDRMMNRWGFTSLEGLAAFKAITNGHHDSIKLIRKNRRKAKGYA